MVTPMGQQSGLPDHVTVQELGETRADGERRRIVMINLGPQHPSTHGVLRLKTYLEGETIVHIEPVIGYLHRSVEKIAEDGSYLQFIHLTDRLDYLQAMNNNHAFCHAVETLAGVEVPERADYIRVMALEINRIASHFLWLGTFGLDVGAFSPLFWALRDREGAISLLERLSGARLTYNWIRIGGVKNDIPPGFLDELRRYLDYLPARLAEFENVFSGNDIFRARTIGVGVLKKDTALEYGLCGPMLRSAGVRWDLRKDMPYSVYPKLDFKVPVGRHGDNYDRYLLRLEEMKQSINILHQCIDQIPATGDYIAPEVGAGARQHRFKPPAGEVYAATESAKGEMGCYIVSDGTASPYRLKWRAPTLHNLQVLPELVTGLKIPDVIATLGSIDIVLGDIDR